MMCGCISQVRGEGRELRNCDAGGKKHWEGNFLSNRKTNTVVMKTCLKMGHGVWGVVPVEGRTGTSRESHALGVWLADMTLKFPPYLW
jgi:hypothetical protein